jgi:hypothetical protein
LPPFRLSRATLDRLREQFSGAPELVQWNEIHTVDIDIYESVCAEIGPTGSQSELLRRLERLDRSRCAYYLTHRADALVALNGIASFLESCEQVLIGRTIEAYDLLGANAHARRIREAKGNTGIRNPTGDISDARLPYAVAHWTLFFMP